MYWSNPGRREAPTATGMDRRFQVVARLDRFKSSIHVCGLCVYLPCAESSREQCADARLDLQDDAGHYLDHSRTIYLVGEFNARLGCQLSPAVPADLRTVAPLQGETTVNSNGRAQLQFFRDNNADFVSGPSMSSPTCTSHRRNRLNLGVGTSVVDHVHRVKGDATRTPALPACTDHGHATHGPALQLLASGHGAVVVFRG